ncbi:MAG: putative glycoside hydrolase [Patescibacteria group bacterium]
MSGRFYKYGILIAAGFAAIFVIPNFFADTADRNSISTEVLNSIQEEKIIHVPTPQAVKAIYMTSWVAGTPKWRAELADFIKKSEINSIVIDIKDYTGTIAFDTENSLVKSVGSEEIRVKDLKEFIKTLHDNGIYVIARITVFQDPVYAKYNPKIAVQTKSGLTWKDKKGLLYIDPSAEEFWNYTVAVAKSAEKIGFDELNFDYIRYPSDGNMRDIAFPVSSKATTTSIDLPLTKEILLENFFKYLRRELKDVGVPISADVFGMVMTNYDGLNIGQVLERIHPYFDYVSPMVYPSHYPATFQGFKNPAAYPYEVVKYSMDRGVARMVMASSSPLKLRPWLQDFDLGATYDAAKIRAQIQGTYDSGLTSWMMWDPSNEYTRGGYLDN